jgi:hypothetical protein
MTISFLNDKFPALDATDGQHLYLSLGSFWTSIFNDKNVLKGYTLGMAEELIQAYYSLLEMVKQYSVKDVDLFHKEKWKPIIIKKSQFSKAPFVFEKNGAVFGYQPDTDKFYANKLFRFGSPKQTTDKLYSYTPDFPLKKFGLIANRVIAPSFVMIPGVDVLYSNGVLYFNDNLFNNDYIPRAQIIGEFGVPQTFVDTEGKITNDEFIILWVYNSEEDRESVYSNFGVLLDLYLPSSESYKNIISGLFNLLIDGPNIKALNIIFAAFNKTPTILENYETIEDIYLQENTHYIITDKHVYKISAEKGMASNVKVGAKLAAGEILSDSVKLVDSLINPAWWRYEIESNKLAFSSHVFMVNPSHQLFFENSIKLLTYANGKFTFPISGRPEDVDSFHDYINASPVKEELVQKLGRAADESFSLAINPLDFVFTNVFKNNTLLLKLNFYDDLELSNFFDLLPNIQNYIPAHVYLIVYLTLKIAPDNIDHMNHGLTIPGFGSQLFSLDGSVAATGSRPVLPGGADADYYKDYINRLFCVSIGPYRNDQPLHHNNNLEQVYLNGSTASTRVIDGALRTEIPLSVKPIGEDTPRTPSTREIPSVLLIDF